MPAPSSAEPCDRKHTFGHRNRPWPPRSPAPSPPGAAARGEGRVTLVTGLEGPVVTAEPVTCGYCHHAVVTVDDHATTCPWMPGKAAAW
ncbi:hypothetical protein [Streptomyces mayteni]